MGRIFHVRLNLDDLSSHNDTFGTDAERGEWLRGFLAGARGAPCRFVDGSPGFLGHSLGAESLAHASKYHDQQSAFGAKSAEARRAKYGTAQPERPSKGGSNDPLKVVQGLPEGAPNLSNNPIIHKENNPLSQQTNKPERERQATRRFAPPTIFEVTEYCTSRGNGIDPQKFMARNESIGWMVGKHPMKDWKAAIRTWEANQAEWNPPAVAIDYGKAPPINFGAM